MAVPMSTSYSNPQTEQVRVCDQIALHIEKLILNGSLQTGERLPSERVLASRLCVSRSSVREALQKLIAKGLLTSKRGGGTWVSKSFGTSFSDPLLALLETYPKAHIDLLKYRATIEGDAAHCAALYATEEDRQLLTERFYDLMQKNQEEDHEAEGIADARFHLCIAKASQNMVYYHLMKGLFELNKKRIITNIGGVFKDTGLGHILAQQHKAIYEAIMDRKAIKAREASQTHLNFVIQLLDKEDSASQPLNAELPPAQILATA
jgi:GntR family transcriptional repressor for pyruvate dehydrogenase complex